MKKSLLIVVGVFVVVAIFLWVLVKPKSFNSSQEELNHFLKYSMHEQADVAFRKILQEDSLNLDWHVGYIKNHYVIPPTKEVDGTTYYRDDEHILNYYSNKLISNQFNIRDIGFYGLGLIGSINGNYQNALNCFIAVSDSNLKYLNNSLGFIYLSYINDYSKAEQYFLREIELGGNVVGAYSNLINLKINLKDYVSLYNLLKTDAQKYFPQDIKRLLYIQHGNLVQYFWTIISNYKNIDFFSILGATIIMLIYLIYLRKIDIYEQEKWKYIFGVFLLGIIFSEFTFLLSDINNFFIGFTLNGKVLNDLFYSIIGIGVIEELVKIIPLLLILRFTKQVNEPVDYIIYASVSALGFAFMENLLYFTYYGPGIFTARALTAVVFHMFLSSLVAYGLIVKHFHNGSKYSFLYYFLLAAVLHGLYDFWMINESVSTFSIISIVLYILCLTFYNTMISNSLSCSQFFDSRIILNNHRLQDYLIYTISGVFLLQYIILVFQLGVEDGSDAFSKTIISGGYLLFFIASNLGSIRIKKGEWVPFKFRFLAKNRANEFDLDEVIGSKYTFTLISKNHLLKFYLPSEGEVLKRDSFSNDDDWYFIKLSQNAEGSNFVADTILVKSKNRAKPIAKEGAFEVGVYLIPHEDLIASTEKSRHDFTFVGWAKMKYLGSS